MSADLFSEDGDEGSKTRRRTSISLLSFGSEPPSATATEFPLLQSPEGFRDEDNQYSASSSSPSMFVPPPPLVLQGAGLDDSSSSDADFLPPPPPQFDDSTDSAFAAPLNDSALAAIPPPPEDTMPEAAAASSAAGNTSRRDLLCDGTILKLEELIQDFRSVIDLVESNLFSSGEHPDRYAEYKSLMWDACKSLVVSTRSIVTGANDEVTLGQAAEVAFECVSRLCDAACQAAESLAPEEQAQQITLLQSATGLAEAVNETLIVARGACGCSVDDPVMRLVLDKAKVLAQLVSQLMKVLRDS